MSVQTIYLSPHLDDAVLSCGGRLWIAQGRGEPQRVITICGGVPARARFSRFARELHVKWGGAPRMVELRRAEDRAALARLGVLDVVHLEVRDAIYRLTADGRLPYNSFRCLFGPPDAAEARLPSLLADRLQRLLPKPGRALIYAPLGVGHHVDHQLTHAAAVRLARRGYDVLYYEDLPYAARTGTLEVALSDKPGWRMQALELDEEALQAKVDALSYYRSQLAMLFGDGVAMGRELARYAARVAPRGWRYAERIWSPPAAVAALARPARQRVGVLVPVLAAGARSGVPGRQAPPARAAKMASHRNGNGRQHA